MRNKIALNFLPLENQTFNFSVYRKLKTGNQNKPREALKEYKLPATNNNSTEWLKYWISFIKEEDYEEFVCTSNTNIYLTEMYLFWKLKIQAEEKISSQSVKLHDNYHPKRISFTIKEHKISKQVIWLDAYYLKHTKEFGFLIDFDFLKNKDYPFNKEVQKLSLSLDNYYRANKDYHLDKYDFVKIFVKNTLLDINQLDNSIVISTKLK